MRPNINTRRIIAKPVKVVETSKKGEKSRNYKGLPFQYFNTLYQLHPYHIIKAKKREMKIDESSLLMLLEISHNSGVLCLSTFTSKIMSRRIAFNAVEREVNAGNLYKRKHRYYLTGNGKAIVDKINKSINFC